MVERKIAYFSMEIALERGMPTYSGGLGVLAGDTVRSAADLKIPMIVVTLLHRRGFFYQRLDPDGTQREEPVEWVVEDFLEELPAWASVHIGGREVRIRAWRRDVTGVTGGNVPVLFLDADLPENSEEDRRLTDTLYGGDSGYRLRQEVILGIGGVRILRALGCDEIERFHMNEGHAGLLTIELLAEEAKRSGRTAITGRDIEAVREICIFTTHTPVPAGHDQFPIELVREVLGPLRNYIDFEDVLSVDVMSRILREGKDKSLAAGAGTGNPGLNMTYLALNLSGYINGVAKKHGEVSRHMFAEYTIDAITNGVHAATWICPAFRQVFDKHIPGWREDNFSLRYAISIPSEEIWEAHFAAKKELILRINRAANAGFDVDHLTLGFARRAATYKRADLLFHDLSKLRRLSEQAGPIQVVFAGKAHPRDDQGKEIIRKIFQAKEALGGSVRVAYLPNYDIELGAMITSGVDVWLNTPMPPNEASGTSGMKAALNGVPSLSILDGWWIEGRIEGITGWAIGDGGPAESPDSARDADDLYRKLENEVAPCFYNNRPRFIDIMKYCIALNGSFFNTQRMVQQYAVNAYLR